MAIRRDVIISKSEYDLLSKKAFLYDLIYGYSKANGYTPDQYIISFGGVEVAINEDTAEDDLTDAVEEN